MSSRVLPLRHRPRVKASCTHRLCKLSTTSDLEDRHPIYACLQLQSHRRSMNSSFPKYRQPTRLSIALYHPGPANNTHAVLPVREITRLPKEARDNIYGRVLKIPEQFHLTSGSTFSDRGKLRKRSQYRTYHECQNRPHNFRIQILQTCQLLHQYGETFLWNFIERTTILWKVVQDVHGERNLIPETLLKNFGPSLRKLDLVGIPRFYEHQYDSWLERDWMKMQHGGSSPPHRRDDFAVLNRMPKLEVLTIIAPYESTWDTDAFQFDDDLKACVEDGEDVDKVLLAMEKALRHNYCKRDSFGHFYEVLKRKKQAERIFTIHMIMTQRITSTRNRFDRIIDIYLVSGISSCLMAHANHCHAESQT